MTAVYSQRVIFGDSPHDLPTVRRHCQRALHALLVLTSRCLFQFNLESSTTPRYFTSFFRQTRVSLILGRIILSSFLFFVNKTISVFAGFTDSERSVHHFSTIFKAPCIRLQSTLSYLPVSRIARSSA